MSGNSSIERPEIGVYLKDAAPLIRLVKRLMVSGYDLINAEAALPRRDRVTVYLSNHGPMFAPLPAPALTVDYLLEHGGYDDLIAVTLFHRAIEFLPGASTLLTHYFGHSTRELSSLSGLIGLMKARAFNIIGTAPEGSSCLGAYDEPVGPFTKVGLMKAALEADADIVLTAQKGIECFGRKVRFPLGIALPIFHGPRGIQLPTYYPGQRARVTLKYRRYEPRLTAAQREALSASDHRAQLGEEFDRIRRQLLALYESI